MHEIIENTGKTISSTSRKDFIKDLYKFDEALVKRERDYKALIPLKQELEIIGAKNKVDSHFKTTLKGGTHRDYKRYCDIGSIYPSRRRYSFISK